MHKGRNLILMSGLVVLHSLSLLPISVQAENSTEASLDGQVFSLIIAGSGHNSNMDY